jgi:hypothetical protein
MAGVLSVFWFAGVLLFFLRFVRPQRKQGKEVNETLVGPMAADLSSQALQLDELRLWMFLEWLQCHCSGDQTEWVNQDEDEIRHYLSCWLERFSPNDLHAEHELIMTEINWWKTADDKTLLRCISKDFAERALVQ